MLYLYILINLLLMFIIYLVKRRSAKPIIVINFFWYFIMFIASLNLYELYPISTKTFEIAALFLLTLNIPFILFSICSREKNKSIIVRTNTHEILIQLLIVSLYFVLIMMYAYISFKYGFTYIFDQNYRSVLFHSTDFSIIEFILGNLIKPVIIFLLLLVFSLDENPKTNRFIKHVLIIILIFSLIISSRIELVRAFTLLLLLYLFSYNGIKRKNRRYFLKIFLIVFLFLVVIVNIRNFTNYNLLETIFKAFYIDFTGSFRVFDNFLINDFFHSNYFNGYSFSLIGGFWDLIQNIIEHFGVSLNRIKHSIDVFTNQTIQISPSINFNAFYSILFYFSLDGGQIALFLRTIILGLFLAYSYKKYIFNNSLKYYMIFIFVMHVIIFGIFRWEFYSLWAWFVIILIYIFDKIDLKVGNRNEWK